MRAFVLILIAAWCSLPSHAPAQDTVREAVVKVLVSQRVPDFVRPWTKSQSRESSGSGVVIDGNRILTSAHVVLYSSRVHVQAYQSSRRVLARVVAVAPDIDLAILTTEDPGFFDGRPTLPLSPQMPRLRDSINVYGYPLGGEQISVTEGIVSRIESARITYFGTGLRIQIDAALNPGNSGGPAILDGKMVGLAFSGIQQAENIGYVIGSEEIERFLATVQATTYPGRPAIRDQLQTVENESLRQWLQLESAQGGLLVTEPYQDAPDYPLQLYDVITKIGDYQLDRKGFAQIESGLKLSYEYLIPKLADGQTIPLTVVRQGQLQEIRLPVVYQPNLLIPTLDGKYPSYFIFGPMLFTTPSQEFLRALDRYLYVLAALESPLATRWMDKPAYEGEQLVTLGAQLFPHATSEGYEKIGFAVVSSINGVAVRNLAHAAQLLRDYQDEFLKLELEGASTRVLVFRTQEVRDATAEILEDEGIRSPYSDDLAEIWSGPRKAQ